VHYTGGRKEQTSTGIMFRRRCTGHRDILAVPERAYCQTPALFDHMRHRSVEAICKYDRFYEDKRLISPNAFAYGSDGIAPNPAAVERLLKNLSGNIYFGTFPSEVRPEFVTPEMVGLVTSYCANKEIHLGGQSGSDRMLKAIHRGHSAARVVEASIIVKDAGLTPVVDFIFGMPGEREEDQAATLDCIQAIIREGGKIRAHYFTPLPGTERLAPSRKRWRRRLIILESWPWADG
jgi:B12-binding domain/radical SAM domain protein